MEIRYLSDKEFKAMVIKMLTKLGRKMEENEKKHSENLKRKYKSET